MVHHPGQDMGHVGHLHGGRVEAVLQGQLGAVGFSPVALTAAVGRRVQALALHEDVDVAGDFVV